MDLSQVLLGKIKFYYRSDDKVIGQRIALDKYEKYETAIMLSQVNSDSVVIDAGANIGYYTVLLAKRVKKVYAFEPDKTAFEILKKNVKVNKLKNVEIFNKAVGSKKESKFLKTDSENFGNSKVVTSNTKQETRIVRLDEVIKEKVDLIKIDVQGYELEVLEGMGKMTVPVMFLEIDQKNIKKLKTHLVGQAKYKYIWSINDFAETPWPIWKGIQIKNNNGYVDLWMKNEMSLNDYLTMLKNVNYKKFLRGIIHSWRK